MLPASIGTVQSQFWHIRDMSTNIRFTISYLMTYPAIVIFYNDIFHKHLHIQLMIRTTICLSTLPTLDGPNVILIFSYMTFIPHDVGINFAPNKIIYNHLKRHELFLL